MSDLCPVAVAATHWKGPQPQTVAEANLCLLKQKRLCDVVFTFETPPSQIEAHQFCLRARSPVFDSMLRGRGSFGERKEIKITETTPEMFQQFLEFIYADKFEVNLLGALDLLTLAHKYEVEPLIAKCSGILHNEIQVAEALEVFQTANRLGNLDGLKEKAADIIASSLETLSKDEKFIASLEEETMTFLLKRDALPLKEVELFKLALRWGERRVQATNNATANEGALKKTLAKCLPAVRYCTMTPQEFTAVVRPTQLLSPEDVIDVYAYLCGDTWDREEVVARRRFSTVPRHSVELNTVPRHPVTLKTVPKDTRKGVVYFYENKDGHYQVQGSEPLNECISFFSQYPRAIKNPAIVAKIKKLAIVGILLQWPTRTVLSLRSVKSDPTLSFIVSLRRFSNTGQIDDETLSCKYEKTVRNCSAGELTEIPVEPRMELLHNVDYCVTLKDYYNLDGKHKPDGSMQFRYSWTTELQNLKTITQTVVGDESVEFYELRREVSLPDFPNPIYKNAVTIRGVRVAAV